MARVKAQAALLTVPALACAVLLSAPSVPAEGAFGATAFPRHRPNVEGSGLRLNFQARDKAAYCLLSDPCLHINAAMESAQLAPSTPARTWLRGLGMLSAGHTLELRLQGGPGAAPSLALSLDSQPLTLPLPLSSNPPSAPLASSEAFQVEAIHLPGTGASAPAPPHLVVTAPVCRVRVLVRLLPAEPAAPEPVPLRIAVEVLDWQNLDGPHGILGQILPNRATSLGSAASSLPTAASSSGAGSGGGVLRGMRGHPPSALQDVQVALERLRTLQAPQDGVLDGMPEDYLASGLLEADCIFSRFNLRHDHSPSRSQAQGEDHSERDRTRQVPAESSASEDSPDIPDDLENSYFSTSRRYTH